MKPPAFQFYADDFIGGTFTMTHEERGLYILLLCLQWTHGSVSESDLSRLGTAIGLPSLATVKAKFVQGADGMFRNVRMESERAKQNKFRENRSKSGKTGADKRWHSHSTAIVSPMANGMANDSSPSPSPSPMLTQSSVGNPSLLEVLGRAAIIGLAPWKAEDWFNEMEGCGWLDYSKRPIVHWQSVLTRVKVKWEADGRPAGPPAQKQAAGNGRAHTPPPTETLKEQCARMTREAL